MPIAPDGRAAPSLTSWLRQYHSGDDAQVAVARGGDVAGFAFAAFGAVKYLPRSRRALTDFSGEPSRLRTCDLH
jgi:hypothetical protein